MLSPTWWKKNLGGIIFSSFAALLVYALGQYISSAITREMKGYLPLAVWNQWAQEREEWRGKVDSEIRSMEAEMGKSRQENLLELRDVSREIAKVSAVLSDLKDSFLRHEQLDAERSIRQPQSSLPKPNPPTNPYE